MADENIPVQQPISEDAFKALETAPVTVNPVTNPNQPLDAQAGQATTQHMGQPPADGAPGSRNEQVDLSKESAPAAQPAQQAPAAPALPQSPTASQLIEQLSQGAYKTWDEVQAAINKPPVEKVVEKPVTIVKPLEFPNEQAQKFYEAVAKGQYAETAPFIQQHIFRSQVETMSSEQLVKAHIKQQYPSFDDTDVQAEFDRLYKPDDLQLNAADFAREQKKANDRLTRDAKTAKEEFLRIEPKLELPVNQQAAQPAAPAKPELTPESKAIAEYGNTFNVDTISKFPFEFEPQDKSTKITGEIELPAEQVTAVADKIRANPEAFLSGYFNRWLQANGEYNVDAIARDVLVLGNPGIIANQVAQKAYLQTYNAKLQRDRNYQPDNQRGDATGVMPVAADADKEKLYKFFGIPDKR